MRALKRARLSRLLFGCDQFFSCFKLKAGFFFRLVRSVSSFCSLLQLCFHCIKLDNVELWGTQGMNRQGTQCFQSGIWDLELSVASRYKNEIWDLWAKLVLFSLIFLFTPKKVLSAIYSPDLLKVSSFMQYLRVKCGLQVTFHCPKYCKKVPINCIEIQVKSKLAVKSSSVSKILTPYRMD